MKSLKQLVWIVLIAAVGAGGWYYRDQLPVGFPGSYKGEQSAKKRGGAERTVAVDLALASSGVVKVTVEAVGTAQANEAVELTSKVTGIVKRLHFDDGQEVKKNEILVELDPGEVLAHLEENRADRDIARRLYERSAKLFKSRNVPEARVEELQGNLQAAEARVRADQARMAEYVIRAPFAGRLGIREVSPGALIRPGTRITTLDDTTTIKLDFEVPETALAKLTPGLEISATGAAFPDRVFFGQVVTVDSRVDPVSRSIRVRAAVPNSDGLLKPGMFLTVQLVMGRRSNATLVPEEAVVASGASKFVYRVEDGKARRSPAVLGQRLPGLVEVLSGVKPGDQVIVGGVQKVRDGVPVRDAKAANTGSPNGESKRPAGKTAPQS